MEAHRRAVGAADWYSGLKAGPYTRCDAAVIGALMASVFLYADEPQDESHWANPMGALRRAFADTATGDHGLASGPEQADVVLLCGFQRNSLFPMACWRDPILRRHRDKVVRLSREDADLHWLPGIYTSLERRRHSLPCFLGGVYPHVAEREPHGPFPLDDACVHLFSFMGDSRTHAVRARLLGLCHKRGRLADTSSHPGNVRGQSADVYRDFKDSYFDCLRGSKFILCPRGKCPSTIRVFETMKAGRVPVILSDDWVPPSGPRWDDFCIFVNEADVAHIPAILEQAEPEFPSRAQRARHEWERWFALDRLADTVTDWAVRILESASRVPARVLLRELLAWHTWRRGVLPEVRRRFGLHSSA